MKNSFVEKNNKQLPENIRVAINHLLKKLKSEIKYPTDKYEEIKDDKIYKVVRSRGDVFESVKELMDLIDITNSDDDKLKSELVEGLEKTYDELQVVILRDIPETVTDDFMTSVSNAIKLAAKLSKQILTSITLLVDKDAINKQKVEEQNTGTIAEQYAIN